MEAKVQAARNSEINKYMNLNGLFVAFNASASILTIFTPAITLVIYSIQAELRGEKSIDVNMAFTSLAIINHLEGTAISIVDATVRPASTANPVLRHINTTIQKGSLIVCCGAVGTGKTTLAKALLGDLQLDTGTIKTVFGLTAYYSQSPWSPNGTMKAIIQAPPDIGDQAVDSWSRRVIEACDLDEDLFKFPDGDRTIIGSRGITLSGGQKHRVALARAVFAHHDMIILDDILAALDATTETKVVDQLFGPNGLCKEMGTTVLLITHATHHLPLADQIIVLDEDGTIAEQGSWEDLRKDAGYISRVILKEKQDSLTKSGEDTKKNNNIHDSGAPKPDLDVQDTTRRTGDISLYGYYFGAIGWLPLVLLSFSMLIYAIFLGSMPY
ncbi:P-loop containing nucleoside triphosphate hydrolase protein [Rhexocercosporidium sp. MPI-PUGE-AT-0058]|nr:P-loop containing nucleoside triphosphate hydrolase protein [Rhexocercosporidium sp. MPI-PUGE-AT-0058]